jgi:chorismate mutase
MKNKKPKTILKLRKEIDKIDGKILDLLNKRTVLTEKIMKIKRKTGMKITDKEREKEIIENLKKKTKNKILKKYLKPIYKIIFKISKENLPRS